MIRSLVWVLAFGVCWMTSSIRPLEKGAGVGKLCPYVFWVLRAIRKKKSICTAKSYGDLISYIRIDNICSSMIFGCSLSPNKDFTTANDTIDIDKASLVLNQVKVKLWKVLLYVNKAGL